jgi:putative ABC transport system permease protein
VFRLAVRSVLARWGRVVLTALAIVASTAFLSGTFIFRDTVQRTFDALFADLYQRVDVYVESSNTVELAFGFESRDRLPVDVVQQVAAVPGVADAQPFVQDDVVVIGKDGKPLERKTAATSGGTLNEGALSVWKVIEGRRPSGENEVVLERGTAAEAKYRVGDTVKLNAAGGSRDFSLVGILAYNDIASPNNATWALFDAPTAESFVGKPGYVDAVLVRGDGTVSDAQLSQRVGAALDPDVAESLTRRQITQQTQTEVQKALGFVTLFLSIFSFIALGVGGFVIYNVFSITTAQRQRENALLRAVGASSRQVTAALLVEALVIGLVGSFLGLLGGVGLALGIRNLLSTLGFSIPARGLEVAGSTVLITIVAGVVATLLAAVAPAIRAGRVPPVAAMADTAFERTGSVRGRLIGAGACVAVGIATIIAVVNGAAGELLALAVLLIFVGVILLGPVMAKPIARILGAPVQRVRGITGSMARGNVQRNPKRTARTAAPVLIGVALVTGATVFAASIKAQLRDTIGSTFIGDYVVNSTNGGSLSFSQTFVDDLNALPQVGAATGLGFATVVFADGRSAVGSTIDPATAGELLDYRFVQGSFNDLTPDGLLVSSGEAKRRDLTVGSAVQILLDAKPRTLTVRGIYSSTDLAQARVYDRHLFDGTGISNPAGIVFMKRAAGVSDAQLRSAVNAVIARYGIGQLQDRNQFINARSDLVDQSLTFIYGLLALSIVIAVFGIVLTLLLAVYERRRETGLLRAVGMTRSQVRVTVRWESVITSLYGAIVGVVMGLVLGYIIILSLRDQGLDHFEVPVRNVTVIIVLAFVVGVLAAVIPARRATKIDILTAIATD